eukprot:scaffold16443_cov59-Phaeocystis_antarctica.AAC.2
MKGTERKWGAGRSGARASRTRRAQIAGASRAPTRRLPLPLVDAQALPLPLAAYRSHSRPLVPTRRRPGSDWEHDCSDWEHDWREWEHIVATRRTDSGLVAATRARDSDTGEAPRGGEGDDSLRRGARAGADSPLRDAPRHYRVHRHFLRGPSLCRLLINLCSVKCTLQERRSFDYGGIARQNSLAASRVVFFGAPGECRGIFSPLGASTRPSSLRPRTRCLCFPRTDTP